MSTINDLEILNFFIENQSEIYKEFMCTTNNTRKQFSLKKHIFTIDKSDTKFSVHYDNVEIFFLIIENSVLTNLININLYTNIYFSYFEPSKKNISFKITDCNEIQSYDLSYILNLSEEEQFLLSTTCVIDNEYIEVYKNFYNFLDKFKTNFRYNSFNINIDLE